MGQADNNETGETEDVMEQEDDNSAPDSDSESEEENYEKKILEIQEKVFELIFFNVFAS